MDEFATIYSECSQSLQNRTIVGPGNRCSFGLLIITNSFLSHFAKFTPKLQNVDRTYFLMQPLQQLWKLRLKSSAPERWPGHRSSAQRQDSAELRLKRKPRQLLCLQEDGKQNSRNSVNK